MTKGYNTLLFYYDSDGNVTSFKYGGTMYYYIKNLQGDIVKIINQAGTVYASYVYDAWGNIKNVSGDTTLRELNPFCYRGYVYDSESGLYYLQSRYYDPFTGRFINADDTDYIKSTNSVLRINIFIYCGNNSVNLLDSSGYFWMSINAGAVTPIIYRSGNSTKCELYIKIKSSEFISSLRYKSIYVKSGSKTYLSRKAGKRWRQHDFTAKKSGYVYICKFNVPLNTNRVNIKINSLQIYRLSGGWLSMYSPISGECRIR